MTNAMEVCCRPDEACPRDEGRGSSGNGRDEELVRCAQRGDGRAVSELYTAYAPRIRRFCLYLVRNEDDAADLASEVFLKAMERMGTLKDPAAFCSWLYRIARNTAFTHNAARSRFVALPDDVDEWGLPCEQAELEIGPRYELTSLLGEAAATLNPRYAWLFELVGHQGRDASAVAKALDVSVAHAYVLISRMKESLREALCAVQIASGPRGWCRDLDAVAAEFGDERSPRMRQTVLRHVRRCQRCKTRVHPSLLRVC